MLSSLIFPGHSHAQGKARVTRYLLNHGAHDSLKRKNKMGCTPVDLARKFGPHPEVEKELVFHMLNQSSAYQLAMRRGQGLLMDHRASMTTPAREVPKEDEGGVELTSVAPIRSDEPHSRPQQLGSDTADIEAPAMDGVLYRSMC